MTLLEQARESRAAAQTALDALISTAEKETRSLSETETADFSSKVEEIRGLDTHIAELVTADELRSKGAADAKHYSPAVVKSEPQVYTGANDGPSYIRDLWSSRNGDFAARDRLVRSQAERKAEGKETAAQRYSEKRAGETTTTGAGGEFAPPMWAESAWIPLARAGRPFANIVGSAPLPLGYSVIDFPSITAGTTVAKITTQNTAISQTDITTSAISAPVNTIAGGATVSQSLLDQSPVNPDQILLADLAAAYATAVDLAVITAATTGGGTVLTYTNAAPTTLTVNQQVVNVVQTLHSLRFAPANAIVMTPRRWANFLSFGDTSNRPLVVPNSSPAFNATGVQGPDAAQGYAGTLYGLPVYLDASIPTNIGAGTNQDRILVVKTDDIVLMEGDINADVFPQTFAQNMSVFVRVFAYSAIAVKQPKGSYYLDGTGLIPPALGA